MLAVPSKWGLARRVLLYCVCDGGREDELCQVEVQLLFLDAFAAGVTLGMEASIDAGDKRSTEDLPT